MRYYKQQGTAVVGVDLYGNSDDISDPDTISHLLEQCDAIVHTATLVSNAMKDSDMWRVNVLATRHSAHISGLSSLPSPGWVHYCPLKDSAKVSLYWCCLCTH